MKRNSLKRLLKAVSGLLSVALIAACASISASADTVIKSRIQRAMAIAAPYKEGDIHFEYNNSLFSTTLKYHNISTYSYVEQTSDVNYSDFEEEIRKTFSKSQSNDLNYLALSGHGNADSINLNGVHAIKYSDIKKILDSIPGHFVIFIDSCHSGGAIGQSVVAADSNEYSAKDIINSFLYGSSESDVMAAGGLAPNYKYTVFCSSLSDQESWYYTNIYGFAMYTWAKAMGYDAKEKTYTDYPCDVNHDGIIRPSELHNYAYDIFNSTFETNKPQTLCYSSPCSFESVFYKYRTYGDVNLDNCIDSTDVLCINQYLAGASLDSYQLHLADVNFDGAVTTADVLTLNQYLAQIMV